MEKKKANANQKPVHVVRCGEVTAAIHQRQSNAGFTYCDFALSRSWRSMASGKETHGSAFFANHEQDLIRAVQEAATWLRQQGYAPSSVDTPPVAGPGVEQQDHVACAELSPRSGSSERG